MVGSRLPVTYKAWVNASKKGEKKISIKKGTGCLREKGGLGRVLGVGAPGGWGGVVGGREVQESRHKKSKVTISKHK